MSLGHAAFRMTQILRSPNMISDSQRIRAALGFMPWPKVVPDWLYKVSWTLRRFDSDVHPLHLLHLVSRPMASTLKKPLKLTKVQQWSITTLFLVIAGAPFTPFTHHLEELLMEILPHHPILAVGLMAGHFVISVVLIRYLFLKVLNARRFHKKQ